MSDQPIRVGLIGAGANTRLLHIPRFQAIDGVEVITPAFFNEFTVKLPKGGTDVIDALADRGVLGGIPAARLDPGHDALGNLIVVASTEINTDADREAYAAALKEVLS